MVPFLIVLFSAIFIFLLISFICFRIVFYSPKRKVLGSDEYDIPKGEIYKQFRDEMVAWIDEIRTLPHEDVSIISRDGLTLRGKYYEYAEGAPVELLFHGYHGTAERDLCGGVSRCFSIGRNALMIDQRASGKSDGHVITFGVKERLDCVDWANYAAKRFGKDSKIILTGISMGAATVMMAAGEELPENVVCILADCGYSSARDIIKKILKEMHLPIGPTYFFIKAGARIFGRFDLEETSPLEVVKKSRVPIIFIHGEDDDFVPCDMSRKLYESCASLKKLVTVPLAGHGLAFPVDKENYLHALRAFEKEWNVK